MKQLFAAALISLSVGYASGASAEVIDLSTLKCGSFLKADKETVGVILAWVDGYYQDKAAAAVIDNDHSGRREGRKKPRIEKVFENQ